MRTSPGARTVGATEPGAFAPPRRSIALAEDEPVDLRGGQFPHGTDGLETALDDAHDPLRAPLPARRSAPKLVSPHGPPGTEQRPRPEETPEATPADPADRHRFARRFRRPKLVVGVTALVGAGVAAVGWLAPAPPGGGTLVGLVRAG